MNTGTWTKEEHRLFLSAVTRYGNDWKEVVKLIPTRTICQVRTHAQKYYAKIEKDKKKAELYGSSLSSKKKEPIRLRKRPPIDYVQLNGDDKDDEDASLPSRKHCRSRKSKPEFSSPSHVECGMCSPLQSLYSGGQTISSYSEGQGTFSFSEGYTLPSYPEGQMIPSYTDRQDISSSPRILNRTSPSSSFSDDSSLSSESTLPSYSFTPPVMIPSAVPRTVNRNPYAYPNVMYIPYIPMWPGIYHP